MSPLTGQQNADGSTGGTLHGQADATGGAGLPLVSGGGVPSKESSSTSGLHRALTVLIYFLVVVVCVPALAWGLSFLMNTFMQPLADARADIRTLDTRVNDHEDRLLNIERDQKPVNEKTGGIDQ